MRLVLASLVSASMMLGLPLVASGQTSARAAHAHAKPPRAAMPTIMAGADADSVLPVWQTADGRTLTVVTGAQVSGGVVPGSASGLRSVDAHSTAASTGLQFNVSPALYGRADVAQRNWLSNAVCQPAQPGARNSVCLDDAPLANMQSGEIGAGFANDDIKLDLSVGQSRTSESAGPLEHAANLPRVLPSASGAAIAAPLAFPDSTATRLSARGQIRILPDTRLDLGASRGRVHFLPNAGLAGAEDLDQTTLSLGIEHGPVSGTIVGRTLQPALPGAALDPSQRWSGIDLGVSVRLPWQGELSFGAQNVWSSGKQPLLNPQDISPDQARVPYVQYHQEL
ncbi:MAG TPA: hypothetical protein VF022_10610 [Rhodanobacteraceae bacterium]